MHMVRLGMPSSKLSWHTLHVVSYILLKFWPVHLQRRLGLGLETHPHLPKLFLCCLNRLTIPCVSYITPEGQADTGVHVFRLLWEQQDCFHEAVLIEEHFDSFYMSKVPPTMILSRYVFSCSMTETNNSLPNQTQEYNWAYWSTSTKVCGVNP